MDPSVGELEKQKLETEKINFQCTNCSMSEQVDFFGKSPPFTKNLGLIEDSYIMKDPFNVPPSKYGKRSFTEYFIILGSHCIMCEAVVCKDCSIFYKSTFCYTCAKEEVHRFPLEIQSKIRKEISAIKHRFD